MSISTFIKYIDLFGTKCTFYNEKMPKLYTVTGGIFSIISILVCILIFIIFSLDDLKRKTPITTISSIPSEGYRKIKFGKEKIWIPWRINDYNNNKIVNHTGLLFPIIYYFSGIKDKITKDFNMTTQLLNYKLCNETSMASKNNILQITAPLSELYCIDMDNLDMGGSWISEYINYIQFDLYYCKDGINYDKNNPKCSSFDKIINSVGQNNSLEVEIYYPVVQFQPTNKTTPVIILYRQYFYHLSKYSSKIERLFLQENVITDDSGWILKRESNNSYWGLNNKQGDSYFIGEGRDIMNEGSTSRAYSFNLYLEPGIIHYKRYYKKLHTIFSDFFPFAFIIFLIMKSISKFFKKVENNKKMVELLFENLKEKPNIFEKNLQRLRIQNNYIKGGRFSYNNINYKKSNEINEINVMRKPKMSIDIHNSKDKIKTYDTLALNNEVINANENNNNSIILFNNSAQNNSIHIKSIHNSSIHNNSNHNNSIHKNSAHNISLNNNSLHKNSFHNNSFHNNSLYNNMQNKTKKSNSKFFQPQNKSLVAVYNNSNQNLITKANNKVDNNFLKLNNYSFIKQSIKSVKPKKEFIKQKLFPYKYYLCSVFIRNLDISKKQNFFSSRFAKIYIFLCQLFDITTYLCLLREFNALKQIYSRKNINLIEKTKKININSISFLKDIIDCIGEHKFHILAQGIKN